jgi:hypothetical protein
MLALIYIKKRFYSFLKDYKKITKIKITKIQYQWIFTRFDHWLVVGYCPCSYPVFSLSIVIVKYL